MDVIKSIRILSEECLFFLYSFFGGKGVCKMDCVIKNGKNVYIRLNGDGRPVSCTESEKMIFEEVKAKNILKNLPKNLKRMNFKIEYEKNNVSGNKESITKTIQNDNYILPDNIREWIRKFGICDDILKEAKKRKDELDVILSNYDRSISNLLHEIELEKKKNAYEGYLKYKELKDIVDERRKAKDEWMIISNVLHMDFRNLDKEVIHKAVAGLAKRKFAYRITEEVEGNAVL